MADFLTRLVSRTLGLAPLAEPLVAAMFAADPPPATMTDADEPLAARPASDERADLSRPRPEPPEVGPASPRMAAAAPDDADRDDAPPRRRRSTPAVDDALPTPATAAPPHRLTGEPMRPVAAPLVTPLWATTISAESIAPTPPASARSPAADLPRPPAQVGQLPEPADRADARPQRAAPVSWDEPDELLLPLEATAAPARPRAAIIAPSDEPERPRAATIALSDESGLPRRLKRGGAAAAAIATPPPPPTIEITIGRVEVRAMHPPAPAARPQPIASTAPRLSLEEYLRNQNGGRR